MTQDKPLAPAIKSGQQNYQAKKREIRPPKKITEKYLHNAGLAYLQRFPASTGHFRTVMMRKVQRSCRFHKDQDTETCAQMLETIIEKFKDLGLLDDNAYLKGMVTSMRRRGLSARLIKAKLAQKGLSEDAVTDALNLHDTEEWEQDGELTGALIHARKKRIGPFVLKDKNQDTNKQMASLARAGYNFGIVKKVLEMQREEAEAILGTI